MGLIYMPPDNSVAGHPAIGAVLSYIASYYEVCGGWPTIKREGGVIRLPSGVFPPHMIRLRAPLAGEKMALPVQVKLVTVPDYKVWLPAVGLADATKLFQLGLAGWIQRFAKLQQLEDYLVEPHIVASPWYEDACKQRGHTEAVFVGIVDLPKMPPPEAFVKIVAEYNPDGGDTPNWRAWALEVLASWQNILLVTEEPS